MLCLDVRRDRLPSSVSANDVREFANWIWTVAFLGKVGAFSDVLIVTVDALVAVSDYGKIAADALPRADTHMWIGTVVPCAAAVIGEMMTKRNTRWGGVVRKLTGASVIRTGMSQEEGANGDLLGVMLVWACKPALAHACKAKSETDSETVSRRNIL